MIFDCDISVSVPTWDFDLKFSGARYIVRKPTAAELARLHDVKSFTNEEDCRAMQDIFTSMTGIDRAIVEQLDHEILHLFFNDVFRYFAA